MAKIGERLHGLGVELPRMLLPKEREDLRKWCVIACDQHTSDRGYWRDVQTAVGDAPSTLNMILPEAYLGGEEEQRRLSRIQACMKEYQKNGVLQQLPRGLIVLQRGFSNKQEKRTGVVLALDLEQYDYHEGSQSLIRATEATIEERIAPRLKIRAQAELELCHIMVFIDDPRRTVIEPLWEDRGAFQRVYQSRLGFSLGEIEGYFVPEEALLGFAQALEALYEEKKAQAEHPILFAMGDGNHSMATAKAHWEQIKKTLSEEERESHPARYALCEIVNIHDEGILFEPIHRTVFANGEGKALEGILGALNALGMQAGLVEAPLGSGQNIAYVSGEKQGYLNLQAPKSAIENGSIDLGIAQYIQAHPKAEVDYIHDPKEAGALAREEGNVSFLLPVIGKGELLPFVEQHGPMPRKSFSMGEEDEKRCYLECRRIVR